MFDIVGQLSSTVSDSPSLQNPRQPSCSIIRADSLGRPKTFETNSRHCRTVALNYLRFAIPGKSPAAKSLDTPQRNARFDRIQCSLVRVYRLRNPPKTPSPTVSMTPLGKKPSLREMLLQHAIVFLICVVFPGAATMMHPVTWLTFERRGTEVHCTARTCGFFIVPFKKQQLAGVVSVTHTERAGKTERKTQLGRTTNGYVHVDGKGFLQIHGDNSKEVVVSVSPVSLDSVQAKCDSFLNSPMAVSTTIFAIANWKFGGIMGGVLCMFTLLYIVGYSMQFLAWVYTRSRTS